MPEPSELEPSQEYLQQRANVAELLAIDSPEEFAARSQEYLDGRVKELTEKSVPTEINVASAVDSFIHPDTEVKPLAFFTGFKLNDPEIYPTFLATLKEQFDASDNKDLGDDRNYRQLLFYSLQTAQQRYFGNAAPSTEGRAQRQSLLERDGAAEVPSITEFKEVAQCVERAAVTHNLMKLVGLESYLVSGDLLEPARHDIQAHTFNLVRASGGNLVIYDPANPWLVKDSEGEPLYAVPALYNGGDQLVQGEMLNVHYRTFVETAQGRLPSENKDLVYKMSETGRANLLNHQ